MGAVLAVSPAFAQFSNQTQAAGLDLPEACAPDHPNVLMYGGGTVGDFNNDGYPDLFVPSGGVEPERLYINNQDGTFSDLAPQWGLGDVYRGCGATAGDYDKDGWQDLYVTSLGGMSGAPAVGDHRLYRNNGSGAFTDEAAAAGVDFTSAAGPAGLGSAFGDIDLDGDLDLFVCGWQPVTDNNVLFRNNGDGTFTNITAAAGLVDPAHAMFSARLADLDRDRYPEVLLAGDFGTSRVYTNNRNGTFTDTTSLLTPDLAHIGMGQTIGDFDRNGWLDWYLTAVYQDVPPPEPNGNRLYMSQPSQGNYVALPESAGVNDGGFGWGTVAVDFDHDGWVDLAETNGWDHPEWLTEQAYLYRNNGDQTFTDIAVAAGLWHVEQSRGMTHFDYDRDGDMDLVIYENDGDLALFRNDLSGPNTNWLRVDLDTSGNPALAPGGFGTRVVAVISGQELVSYLDGGSNYMGRSQLTLHFGLGSVTQVDELRVEWADGFQSVLQNVAANQILTVSAAEPFSQSALVRGQNVDMQLDGALPNEFVTFLYSLAGTGAGPCIPSLGDLCLDLLTPIKILSTVQANGDGTATFSFVVPAGAPLVDVHSQAVIQRGTGGITSAKSNVITAPILP